MDYELTRPCAECPFVEGGVRLYRKRRAEIARSLERSQFVCHKTNEQVGGRGPEQHCAGALIVMEREGVSSQMTRINERLGYYDASKLDLDDERVRWDSLDEWVEEQEGVENDR